MEVVAPSRKAITVNTALASAGGGASGSAGWAWACAPLKPSAEPSSTKSSAPKATMKPAMYLYSVNRKARAPVVIACWIWAALASTESPRPASDWSRYADEEPAPPRGVCGATRTAATWRYSTRLKTRPTALTAGICA